jgi:hypothetical protein
VSKVLDKEMCLFCFFILSDFSLPLISRIATEGIGFDKEGHNHTQ